MLKIKWLDEESKNYSDEIPDTWITSKQAMLNVKHYVVGPKGVSFIARCDVHPSDRVVELDYLPYAEENKRAGAINGVLRLEFLSESKADTPKINWKKSYAGEFKDSSKSAEVSYSSDKDTQYSGWETAFEEKVASSGKLSQEQLALRIAEVPELPRRRRMTTTVFDRNPDVVAYVLHRANGRCESCHSEAPFLSKATGQPYLEVHHRQRLADGGKDIPDNARALCPNCHRKAHFA